MSVCSARCESFVVSVLRSQLATTQLCHRQARTAVALSVWGNEAARAAGCQGGGQTGQVRDTTKSDVWAACEARVESLHQLCFEACLLGTWPETWHSQRQRSTLQTSTLSQTGNGSYTQSAARSGRVATVLAEMVTPACVVIVCVCVRNGGQLADDVRLWKLQLMHSTWTR